MINLGFNSNGDLVSTISTQSATEAELMQSYPDIVSVVSIDHGDAMRLLAPLTLVGGIITGATPPTEAEIAEREAEDILISHAAKESELLLEEVRSKVKDKTIKSKADIDVKIVRGRT